MFAQLPAGFEGFFAKRALTSGMFVLFVLVQLCRSQKRFVAFTDIAFIAFHLFVLFVLMHLQFIARIERLWAINALMLPLVLVRILDMRNQITLRRKWLDVAMRTREWSLVCMRTDVDLQTLGAL